MASPTPTLPAPLTSSKIPLASTSTLAPRFQIRKLTLLDSPHAAAIHYHSNIFHSPKWSSEYAGRQTTACIHAFSIAASLFDAAIVQGLSWGVLDSEFVPKHQSGKEGVYWSELDLDFDDKGGAMSDIEGERVLLAGMDFGLVSICISHDDFIPPPMATMILLAKAMPEVIKLYEVMDPLRKKQLKENKEWEDTKRLGQRLKRAGTATKGGFMGLGLMRGLAGHCVGEARREGWRSVLLNTSASAVAKVWTEYLGGKVVYRVNVSEWEDADGVRIFEKCGSGDSVGIEVVL